MKKLNSVLILFTLTIGMSYALSDYEERMQYDNAYRRYQQDCFNRMMESNRRSSAMDAIYSMQQNNTTLHSPHIPTTDYSYKSTYTVSKPLEVFGR